MSRNAVPRSNESSDLGTESKRWRNVHTKRVYADEVEAGNLLDAAETQTRLNPRAVAGGIRTLNGQMTWPGTESFNFSTSFTVGCKFMVISSNRPSRVALIKKYASSGNQRSWALTLRDDGDLDFIVSADGAANIFNVADTNIEPLRWYSVVATFDKGQIKIVLDDDVVLDSDAGIESVFQSNRTIRFLNSGFTVDGPVDSPVLATDFFAHNYAIPLETTDGIIGIRERIRNGSMVVPGLDDGPSAGVNNSETLSVGGGLSLTGVTNDGFSEPALFSVNGEHFHTEPRFSVVPGTIIEVSFEVTDFDGAADLNVTLSTNTLATSGFVTLDLSGTSTTGPLSGAGSSTNRNWMITGNGVATMRFACASETANARLLFSKRFGDPVTLRISNLSARVLGAPIDIRPESFQPSGVALNLSRAHTGNHPVVSETGVTLTTPKQDGILPWRTATNGSVWVGGSDRPMLLEGHYFRKIIVHSESGGETVQAGSTAGGSDIVASVTLVAGPNHLTIAAPASSTRKLSLTSDSTNELKWQFDYGILQRL